MVRRQDEVLPTFDAFFELATRLGQAIELGLAERGLTTSRAEVLFRLHGRGPMVQRELSQALRCTPRHVTALVDQLQGDKLVDRRPHPTDRRATLVILTGKGRKLAAQMFADRETSARQLLGDVPGSDLATTLTVLRTVLERLAPPGEQRVRAPG
ncbi:MAG TPA: MarR family transcriptional regulator [Actinomycetales bacterium]|nr:MarR family transcriptional regulator [Actinomycetales bacterium]